MRFIPTRVHGILDYLMGVVLIVAPWLLDLDSDAAIWVPVILGVGAIVYSLLTDYELGVMRRIPMSTHLILDMLSGTVLAASPWLFGFADEVWVPHVVLGILEVGAGLMTQTVPSDEAGGARRLG
jgi:hypothetical protein